MRALSAMAGVVLVLNTTATGAWPDRQGASAEPAGACFILLEIGAGEIARDPATTCGVRMSPQSTFKIPHALAALDAGVVSGVDEKIAYDGRPVDLPAWRRDSTLATAMRDSVVWYFQDLARRLGPEREHEYLTRFDYGNKDSSSGLTSFWLGGSLEISPDEELNFLTRLYEGRLPIGRKAMDQVRGILRQPAGSVVNATGVHPFGGTWAPGTIVSAKTGSGRTRSGPSVRWLVGHVARGSRSWLFVSNVAGGDDTPAMAAVDLAASRLQDHHVLR
jgi:beta-lactamase class D